jgi:perosamine synthetase
VNPIALFHPFVPESAIDAVAAVLRSRWVGEGTLVREFEEAFEHRYGGHAVAVNSATSALHLAYLLAGLGPETSAIVPAFGCTATSIPLHYVQARLVFSDIKKHSLLVDPQDVERMIDSTTRAIVCTHYGGFSADLNAIRQLADHANAFVIADAAQCLLRWYNGASLTSLADMTIFSFQAVKHLTTGDGGMLMCRSLELAERARRLRWFGIDRNAKLQDRWDNEINEIGFKYQMNNLDAALGLAGLAGLDRRLENRRQMLDHYRRRFDRTDGIELFDRMIDSKLTAPWAVTVSVANAQSLRVHLASSGIESSPVHYRNDRYVIFRDSQRSLPNLDAIENRYLCLPLHDHLSLNDIERVCDSVDSWVASTSARR